MHQLIELLQRCAIWIQSAIESSPEIEVSGEELLRDIETAIQDEPGERKPRT